MTDEKSTEATAAKEAADKKMADIVRGQIPKPLVYLVRFDEPADAKDGDLAKKYGTTSGKIADIRKNRNFAYIDVDYKPTADEKTAAVTWLKQVPGYDQNGTDAVVVAVEKLDTASEADVASLTAKRAEARAKSAIASGKPATAPKAGGGKGGKKAKGEGQVPTDKESADLMS